MLEDTCATLLEWVSGECIQKAGMNEETAVKLGEMVAKMHNCLSKQSLPNRYSYGTDLTKRMQHTFETVLANSKIERELLDIVQKVLDKITEMLEEKRTEMITVHNDLGESNLLVQEDTIVPIDFSMSGSCVREMDLASLFLHFEDAKMKEAILRGYNSCSTTLADEKLIELCIGYQVLIFIFSQFQVICSQGWFTEALHYWCEEVFAKLLEGKKIADEIGLYN